MADGWDAFSVAPGNGGAVATPAPAPSSDDGWAAFSVPSGGRPAADGAQPTPAPEPDAAPAAKTGYLANAAAGLIRGGSDVLNVMSDPVGNLVGKPLAVVGAALHDTFAPMFGYHKFTPEDRAALFADDMPQIGTRVASAIGRAVDAPSVDTVQPGSMGEQLLQSGVRAGTGKVRMGLAAGASAPALATGFASGASGGVAGDVASTLVPDQYKPIASLAGNVLGAGILSAGASLARGGLGAALDFASPALGRRNALFDPGGAPIVGADSAALTATAGQLRAAGNQLQAVTSDPATVQNVLASPPPPLVAGANPTTAQLTRDPGLAMQEYRASRSGTPLEQAAFRGRADAQNDARVATLGGVADNGDAAAVPAYLQQQASSIADAGNARVAQAQAAAQAQIEQARQAGEQQSGGLQGQAAQALDAVGGNLPAGSDATIGQMLRSPIQETLAQTRQRESGLWNAVDPDGTLAVDMSPVRDRANQIIGDIGPNAAPPAGEEASILGTAQGLPDVQNFRDLTDLRSRLTDQIRAARSDPAQAQQVRRLSMLLDGVHDAMEGGVNGRAAVDNAAVQAGTMAPKHSINARMAAQRAVWYASQTDAARAAQTAQVGTGTAGRNASSGPGSFFPMAGDQVQARGGFGNAQGAPGLSESQPLTPNFDVAAQQRYADARKATADRVATYKNAPGVGQALAQGQTSGSFRTPDSAVPNLIVKAGPQGADVAQAYLRAGGSHSASRRRT